jgi:3'-5' exoribonuclease
MLNDTLKAHWPARRLPDVAHLEDGASGWAFYLCTRKELRTNRQGGTFIHVVLQDASGTVAGRILEGVDRLREEFDAGEFVRVQARADRHNQRLELVIETIRRINPEQDRKDGFSEGDYVQAAPRPADDMWRDLQALVARVEHRHVRLLLETIVSQQEEKLRVWPAALTVHHAYRSGLLEHLLKVAEVGAAIAASYGADADFVIAGAILHDIGKLEELDYDLATSYSLEGNLLGHITIGVRMLNDAACGLDGFPRDVLARLAHLIVSHHGSRDHGSPVEPMTAEALILSAVDDLDATLHQVRRQIAESSGDDRFTAYHPRLGRVFLKPSGR